MKSAIFGWHLGQHVNVNAARSLCAPIHESYTAFFASSTIFYDSRDLKLLDTGFLAVYLQFQRFASN